jgi:hypothetical protein
VQHSFHFVSARNYAVARVALALSFALLVAA